MMRFRMAFGGASYGKYATCITKNDYRELMDYAHKRRVKLEGFRKFSGSVDLIREAVDDIVEIAQDFPKIISERKSIVLRFDEHISERDFATTNRHLISINGNIFNNKDYLEREYQMMTDMGTFVKETSYRSVIRHEVGHVVANIYGLNPMNIAKQVLQMNTENDVLEYVMNNLSLYAAEYEDGREIISESFSAYYSGVDNLFAK